MESFWMMTLRRCREKEENLPKKYSFYHMEVERKWLYLKVGHFHDLSAGG